MDSAFAVVPAAPPAVCSDTTRGAILTRLFNGVVSPPPPPAPLRSVSFFLSTPAVPSCRDAGRGCGFTILLAGVIVVIGFQCGDAAGPFFFVFFFPSAWSRRRCAATAEDDDDDPSEGEG